MNCRFCGNFVPEGRDSCPVCGRRPDEEPIGKLLSENQPNSNQLAEVSEPASTSNQRHPKGLLLPLILIAISVAGWVYGLIGDGQIFLTMLKVATGNGTSISEDSDFVIPNATAAESTAVLIYGALAVLLTIIGLVGVVMLFKRLYNRIKYSK